MRTFEKKVYPLLETMIKIYLKRGFVVMARTKKIARMSTGRGPPQQSVYNNRSACKAALTLLLVRNRGVGPLGGRAAHRSRSVTFLSAPVGNFFWKPARKIFIHQIPVHPQTDHAADLFFLSSQSKISQIPLDPTSVCE
jgi:hypothetical protein